MLKFQLVKFTVINLREILYLSHMNAVNVVNLVKKYKDTEAVKGVSFSVKEGEIFALVGPNGVGKSTTLKMLATILIPTSG